MITIRKIDEALIMTVNMPRIDAAVAVKFRQKVLEEITYPLDNFIIDLELVSFIDSSGLGALISIIKSLNPNKKPIICGPQKSVQTMFALTRMDKVFIIRPDVNTAISILE